jgi:glycosyltransferase involved in cell wall biosynthesis
MPPTLSILIPTLARRRPMLDRLLAALEPQKTDQVELIVQENKPHDQGGPTIGENRQRLLHAATGDYVAMIDDDDAVPMSYVSRILAALEARPDVVGIVGVMMRQGSKSVGSRFYHSIRYTDWFDDGKAFYRPPNHLNPCLSSLAREVGYPPLNHGEDKDYSLRLRPLLKSEVYIEEVIYGYLARPNKTV